MEDQRQAGQDGLARAEAQAAKAPIAGIVWDIALNAIVPVILYELSKRYLSASELTALIIAATFPSAKGIFDLLSHGQADPMQAPISETSLSAESLRLGNEIGSIAPRMQADIVAFDGNPLTDVTAASRAVFVMKGGKVYENLAKGSKGGEDHLAKGAR